MIRLAVSHRRRARAPLVPPVSGEGRFKCGNGAASCRVHLAVSYASSAKRDKYSLCVVMRAPSFVVSGWLLLGRIDGRPSSESP